MKRGEIRDSGAVLHGHFIDGLSEATVPIDPEQHQLDVARLMEETGISERFVIEELIALGIHAGMMRATMLVPAIHVAWANGFVEPKERSAVLQAAERHGISRESATRRLLDLWLETPPSPDLFQAWRDFIASLHDVLDHVSYRSLEKSIISMVRNVAESAGGTRGVAATTVDEERAIRDIQQTFMKCI